MTPRALALGYLNHARKLYDSGKGRVLRRPADVPEEDPYFATLLACYHYGNTGELFSGFVPLDIVRNASMSVYSIGPYPDARFASPLRKAVRLAEAKRQAPPY